VAIDLLLPAAGKERDDWNVLGERQRFARLDLRRHRDRTVE
jgi:hypothetical protein